METVRRWREQGEMPFPDFPPERISEMGGTIEYPPRTRPCGINEGSEQKRGTRASI